MVNLCNLLVKYSHFSRVDDDVFVYIDRILENAYEIHTQQQNIKDDIEKLNKQLEEKRQRAIQSPHSSPSKAWAKKRKFRSIDASLSERKENVSIIEDSRIFPYKSDPENSTTAGSILEQNIVDSEESFFALTQSPPKRDVLSVKNGSEAEHSPETTPHRSISGVARPTGHLLRASLLSDRLASPDRLQRTDEKLVGSSTPKATSSCGKWTSKKQNADNGTPKAERTPAAVKRFHTTVDGSNRLRQTKIKFPIPDDASKNDIQTKSSSHASNDDALLSDFIVPTPPTVSNKSKFLRSLRMKKQSTMVDTTGQQNRSLSKSISTVTETTGKGDMRVAAKSKQPDTVDDEYDIDQTFCPGAESLKLKQEPLTQEKPGSKSLHVPPKWEDPITHFFDSNSEDGDSPGVIIVAPKENTIITIAESQPPKEALFKARFNSLREKNKALPLESKGQTPAGENIKQNNNESLPPTLGAMVKAQGIPYGRIPHDLCSDCLKLYRFHTSCGISDDTARSKLPRNCRSCRLAQLHSTPPGFWDPDFLPTQK